MSILNTFESKNRKNSIESRPVDTVRSRPADIPAPPIDLTVEDNALTLESPMIGFAAAFKRLSDLIIGGIAVLVLLPFFAVLSILIKLDSTGPALFSQQRSGRNGESINVYKFRTMYQNHSTPVPTASSFVQTQKDDPRITRFGAFLRKTSLDELPQLFNVMQGSMSLVGPRPHPAPLDEQFKQYVPALYSRYAVKPGLTGWAQVNGFRGETTRVEDMMQRVAHDRHYIKNWTLWLDIKIIALTAIKGWTHRNAY